MSEAKDFAIGTLKAVASTIPGISSFMKILEEMEYGEYKRRMEEFMSSVDSKINMLTDMQLNSLKNNQLFATVLLISGQLAMKTNDEKRKLLANAVANSAKTNLSEDRVIILLNCIEKYTLQHLKMLRFLQNPKEYTNEDFLFGGSPAQIYEQYYPNSDKDLDRIIIRDLYQDGVSSVDSIHTNCTASGVLSKKTTPLGDDFIQFFNIEK